jgi:nicotinamide-nucleotide adenylyltransferase
MSAVPPEVRGLLVGRFQPFHNGHLAVVRAIRRAHPKEGLILAIGSAEESYTPDNPFTSRERFEMIEAALVGAGVDGWLIVPLPDVHRHGVWVAHAEELLPPFRRVYTHNPLTRHLFERDGYPVESPGWVQRSRYEGRRIRAALARDRGWRPLVPPEVVEILLRIDAPYRLRDLVHPRPARAP